MDKVFSRFILLMVVLFCTIFTLNAQMTVYNNFGEEHDGWDYNYQLGWTVAGYNVPAQFGIEQAMSFTATEEGFLSDIWLGMFSVPDNVSPDTVYVKLALNPEGLPPDPADVIEEWTITGFPGWTQWDPPVHLEGNGTTIILEGESYWLWLVASDYSNTGWCMNIDPNLLCPHTIRRENEDWLGISDETASSFRVDLEPLEGIDGDNEVLSGISLEGNYPNPFNPSTTIKFKAGYIPAKISMAVFNVKGQKVRQLINNELLGGEHSVTWDGKNDSGKSVTSGVYLFQLKTDSEIITHKALLLE
ncbi:MAG: T9SS type A sorting domain-containing protein [Candidatus Cloacimonetes bacterium]|nr:T9SS type A sorting domain-containing protein [Candidatus Cloacimonadota bacterium]